MPKKRVSYSPIMLIAEHPVPALAIGLGFTVMNLLRDYFYYQKIFLSNVFFGCVVICIPFIVVFISKKIRLFTQLSESLFGDEAGNATNSKNLLEFIEQGIWSYIVPLSISIIGATSISIIFEWGHFADEAIFVLFTAVFFFYLGSAGWYYTGLFILIYKIECTFLGANPFKSILRNIKELNSIFLSVFWSGLLIYGLTIFGVWVHGEQFLLRSGLSYVWVFPMAAVVAIYFISCQILFHKILRNYKEKRLEIIDKLVEKTFHDWSGDSTSNKGDSIKVLLDWRKIVENEYEWALDFGSASTTIITIFLPVITTIVDYYQK